ncbi:hypothetical protein EW146_g976 [Bondarzewia mesenterica]|uniref:Uncharacterized protein n=1 Tax=Bondarzewia mesenterica TaxID=1095465 RepID=A0A4S4M5B0_9AGAM|nr:hypothetical protein EW146_g976 [Bondarzewia mesenterica]
MFPGLAKYYSPDLEIRLKVEKLEAPRKLMDEIREKNMVAKKRTRAKDRARRELMLAQAARNSAMETIRLRLREHELAIDMLKSQEQQEELRVREAEQHIVSVRASDDGSLLPCLSHESESNAGSGRSTADDAEEFFTNALEGKGCDFLEMWSEHAHGRLPA